MSLSLIINYQVFLPMPCETRYHLLNFPIVLVFTPSRLKTNHFHMGNVEKRKMFSEVMKAPKRIIKRACRGPVWQLRPAHRLSSVILNMSSVWMSSYVSSRCRSWRSSWKRRSIRRARSWWRRSSWSGTSRTTWLQTGLSRRWCTNWRTSWRPSPTTREKSERWVDGEEWVGLRGGVGTRGGGGGA